MVGSSSRAGSIRNYDRDARLDRFNAMMETILSLTIFDTIDRFSQP
jgi:hypothetical protein